MSIDVAELSNLLSLPDLAADLEGVEQRLDASIGHGNAELVEPSLRVIHGGGKRLRPVLTLAAAVVGGGQIDDDVLQGAAALELVHVGSLVHDDIIDKASTRRGVVTVNAKEGVEHAILVGDFLLSAAGRISAAISREVAATLADAISSLCIGQSLETSTINDPTRSLDSYYRSIDGKTAALVRASCRLGGQAARVDDAAIEALGRFGTAFGMAFQVVDDILDLTSTSDKLGKPAGNDLHEGVYTLPLLLLFDRDPAVRASLPAAAQDEIALAQLIERTRQDGVIEEAAAIAFEHVSTAEDALGSLPPSPQRDGLLKLPRWYVEQTLAG
jgi:geranylgeranyl pyrophosphate synthase